VTASNRTTFRDIPGCGAGENPVRLDSREADHDSRHA
jgi:hypothetical protein